MNTVPVTKKAGRPAKGEKAMSGRTRTMLYRDRDQQKRAMLDAIGDERSASTSTLLDLLKRTLASLDKGSAPDRRRKRVRRG